MPSKTARAASWRLTSVDGSCRPFSVAEAPGGRPTAAPRLSEIATEYLADLACRASPRHVLNVRGKLARVIPTLGDPPVDELRPIDLLRLRNGLRGSGRANRTANLHAAVVVTMLRWAEDAGLIDASPVRRLAPLPESRDCQRYRRRALTPDEARRFLAASEADDARLASPRRVPVTPVWELLLGTGCRYGEARLITWGDVDLDGGVLALRAENTKARRPRALPLRRDLVERLRELRRLHAEILGRKPGAHDRVLLTPTGRPWPWHTAALSRILARVLAAARIQKVDAAGDRVDVHALRHSFATRLARSGAPLMYAQQLLGHASPMLTARVYSHLVTADLRAAVEGMDRSGTVEAQA